MPDTTLDALIRLGIDEPTAKKAADAIKGLDKQTKEVGKSAEEARRSWMRMAEAGEKVASVGLRIGAVGAAMVGPLTLAAANYVKTVGLASEASRRWADSQSDLENSSLRIGKVATESLLPFMEKSVVLADKLAGFIEAHPDIVKAAAVGGTVLASGGAVLGTIGAIMNTVGKLGALLGVGKVAAGVAGAGVVGGAGAGAGAAAGIGALPIVGGLLAGAGTAIGLGRAGQAGIGAIMGQENLRAYQQGMLDLVGKLPVVGTALQDVGAKFANLVQGTNLLGKTAQATAEELAAATKKVTQSAFDIDAEKGLNTYIAFRKQEAAADKAYQKAIAQTNDMTGKALVKAEQAYGKERTKALADFNVSRVRAIRDFDQDQAKTDATAYEDRLKRAKSYGVEIERGEQDHQRTMARMSEDHAKTMRDAIASNDARAAFEEIQNYETERTRAEEDYQTELQRKGTDFAQEVADSEAQRKVDHDERLADFAQRQKDGQEDFDRQQKERKDQYGEQVKEIKDSGKEQVDALTAAYDDQKTAQRAAFTEQLNALHIYLGDEKKVRDLYYADMLSSFKSYMTGVGNLSTVNPRRVGMGDVHQAERESAMAGMASGASGGATLNFQPTYQGMGQQDRSWYNEVARQQAQQVVAQMVQDVRRGRR